MAGWEMTVESSLSLGPSTHSCASGEVWEGRVVRAGQTVGRAHMEGRLVLKGVGLQAEPLFIRCLLPLFMRM